MTEPRFLSHRGRPAVRLERRYDHPVERVWQAVTDPAILIHWFPTEIEFDLAAGKVVFDPNGSEPTDGTVLEADPPHRLAFTWDTDHLEFTLFPDGEGTLLTLVHLFDDKPGAASFATGWELCLAALLNENAPTPQGRKIPERHEELLIRFGLDTPEVTQQSEDWLVVYERQLTCSAEVAWQLFVAAAPGAPMGKATMVDAPQQFAFDVADGVPGESVRVELRPGTGQGARLRLEVSGSGEGDLKAALDVWGSGTVATVAREAAALAVAD